MRKLSHSSLPRPLLPLVYRRSRGPCGEKAIPLSAEDLPRTGE